MTKSEWRITFDPDGTPLVLLDYDELVQAEPTIPQSHTVQVQPYLRSDWPSVWDRGNVQLSMTVNVVKEYATAAAARTAMLTHTLAVAALRHADLRVEVRNGGSQDFAQASIESAEPFVGRELVMSNRVAWTYNLLLAQ